MNNLQVKECVDTSSAVPNVTIVTGPTGIGKSQRFTTMASTIDPTNSYCVYIASSFLQLHDMKTKLDRLGVTNEVIASPLSCLKYEGIYPYLVTSFNNTSAVKLITMGAVMCSPSFTLIQKDQRNKIMTVADEPKLEDVVLPSLLNSPEAIKAYGNILKVNEDKVVINKRDLKQLVDKAYSNDPSPVISRLIAGYDSVQFLTVETLFTEVFRLLGASVNTLGKDKVKFLSSSTINFKVSKHVTAPFLKTNQYKALVKKYDNIISNADEEATYNLESSKGLHLPGNNLVVVRLNPMVVNAKKGLVDSLLPGNTIDVEAKYYYDQITQAVGRSIGFRGSKSVDVIIHSSIMDKVQKLFEDSYYFITFSSLKVSSKSLSTMQGIKSKLETSNSIIASAKREEKLRMLARECSRYITKPIGNSKSSRMSSKELKALGLVFHRISDVAEALGVKVRKDNNNTSFIKVVSVTLYA